VFAATNGYRLSLFVVVALSSVATLIGGTSVPAATIPQPWIDTADRDAVVAAWNVEQRRTTPDMDWTGAVEGCQPGSASVDLALATIARVNYYRAMAGVPANVTLSASYSDRAQHGALAMSATGRLSHEPDESFRCLDDTAREAAANSNLYLGRTGPHAIDGYIEDPGDRNIDVGHRNTILHPPTQQMGVGHVAGDAERHGSNLLWVFDEHVFDPNPELREPNGFVAWPPRGYVPAEIVHPRWSFGMAGADFTDAQVFMTVGDEPVPLTVVTRHSLQDYVPLPIIVWEPEPSHRPVLIGASDDGPASDLTATVTVSDVAIDGQLQSFTYNVILLGEDSLEAPVAVRAAAQTALRLANQAPLPLAD
jgi:uncharacterized protein YkwD